MRFYRQKVLWGLLAVFCLLCFIAKADAGTTSYALQIKEYRIEGHGKGEYENYYTVRLYNARTKHTVWKRKFAFACTSNEQWSRDRRALAMAVDRGRRSSDAILFWRAGHKIWLCPRKRNGENNDDYEFGKFVWSKHKSRVLFRGGSSGSADIDVGRLYCADLRKRKLLYIDTNVHKMEWVSKNTVRYVCEYISSGSKGIVRSYQVKTWHCP